MLRLSYLYFARACKVECSWMGETLRTDGKRGQKEDFHGQSGDAFLKVLWSIKESIFNGELVRAT